MRIPDKLPYFKSAVILVGVLAVVWSAWEGRLLYDLLLAALALALLMARLITGRWGGRVLTPGRTLGLAVVAGASFGLGLALLTLGFMALKMGLHAHGPEYAAAEVAWVWRQAPLWGAAGGLAGLGVGLLVVQRK